MQDDLPYPLPLPLPPASPAPPLAAPRPPLSRPDDLAPFGAMQTGDEALPDFYPLPLPLPPVSAAAPAAEPAFPLPLPPAALAASPAAASALPLGLSDTVSAPALPSAVDQLALPLRLPTPPPNLAAPASASVAPSAPSPLSVPELAPFAPVASGSGWGSGPTAAAAAAATGDTTGSPLSSAPMSASPSQAPADARASAAAPTPPPLVNKVGAPTVTPLTGHVPIPAHLPKPRSRKNPVKKGQRGGGGAKRKRGAHGGEDDEDVAGDGSRRRKQSRGGWGGPGGTQGSRPETFLRKLWKLLNHDPEDVTPYLRWDKTGRLLIIPDEKTLVEKVCKVHFAQKNITSFNKQMNNWDFKRHSRSQRDLAIISKTEPGVNRQTRIWYHTQLHSGSTWNDVQSVGRHEDGMAKKRRVKTKHEGGDGDGDGPEGSQPPKAKRAKTQPPKLEGDEDDGDTAGGKRPRARRASAGAAPSRAGGGADAAARASAALRSTAQGPKRRPRASKAYHSSEEDSDSFSETSSSSGAFGSTSDELDDLTDSDDADADEATDDDADGEPDEELFEARQRSPASGSVAKRKARASSSSAPASASAAKGKGKGKARALPSPAPARRPRTSAASSSPFSGSGAGGTARSTAPAPTTKRAAAAAAAKALREKNEAERAAADEAERERAEAEEAAEALLGSQRGQKVPAKGLKKTTAAAKAAKAFEAKGEDEPMAVDTAEEAVAEDDNPQADQEEEVGLGPDEDAGDEADEGNVVAPRRTPATGMRRTRTSRASEQAAASTTAGATRKKSTAQQKFSRPTRDRSARGTQNPYARGQPKSDAAEAASAGPALGSTRGDRAARRGRRETGASQLSGEATVTREDDHGDASDEVGDGTADDLPSASARLTRTTGRNQNGRDAAAAAPTASTGTDGRKLKGRGGGWYTSPQQDNPRSRDMRRGGAGYAAGTGTGSADGTAGSSRGAAAVAMPLSLQPPATNGRAPHVYSLPRPPHLSGVSAAAAAGAAVMASASASMARSPSASSLASHASHASSQFIYPDASNPYGSSPYPAYPHQAQTPVAVHHHPVRPYAGVYHSEPGLARTAFYYHGASPIPRPYIDPAHLVTEEMLDHGDEAYVYGAEFAEASGSGSGAAGATPYTRQQGDADPEDGYDYAGAVPNIQRAASMLSDLRGGAWTSEDAEMHDGAVEGDWSTLGRSASELFPDFGGNGAGQFAPDRA
ncbi:hypothetical protein JCM3770_000173 [Rhodotorula araucariae]